MATKQVIVVRKDLNMRKGKIAAQVAHASQAFLTLQIKNAPPSRINRTDGAQWVWINVTEVEFDWFCNSFAKVVVSAKDEAELRDLIEKGKAAGLLVREIIDNGQTEFHGVPTLTCAAFGPDEGEKIDPITGHLPLL